MRRTLFAAVLALALAASAAAESTDVDAVTIGALTERADVVVVAEAPRDGGGPFRVVETLRGRDVPAQIEVAFPTSPAAGPPKVVVAPGATYLLFLSSKDGLCRPLELPWAMRDASAGDVKPLVDYARRYAAALGPDAAPAKPVDLAALLVESLASPASGLPACAGRDLLRHADLVEKMTPAQRQSIDQALARPRKGDLDLAGIIDAAGVAGTETSDELLVARLVDPATRHLRLNVTTALHRRARPALVDLLARRLTDATKEQRADLVNALGRLDLREASPHLVAALRDADAAVRVEAAHSVGLLARVVRAPKPGVDVEAPRGKLDAALRPLMDAVAAATSDRERKALVWAVAQIDTADAWTALKTLRDEASEPRLRDLAKEVLLRPRVELILE